MDGYDTCTSDGGVWHCGQNFPTGSASCRQLTWEGGRLAWYLAGADIGKLRYFSNSTNNLNNWARHWICELSWEEGMATPAGELDWPGYWSKFYNLSGIKIQQ